MPSEVSSSNRALLLEPRLGHAGALDVADDVEQSVNEHVCAVADPEGPVAAKPGAGGIVRWSQCA